MITQPSFVAMDIKARESLLSQLGNFTPTERTIFHKMCTSWESEIGYARLLSLVSSESVTAKADTDRLMARLKKERMGLIVTKIQEGQRKPWSIVLCDKHDCRFYQKYVEELILDVIEEPSSLLPSLIHFQDQQLEMPVECLSGLEFSKLVSLLKQPNTSAEPNRIYVIQLDGENSYYTTHHSIKLFLKAVMIKAQFVLNNGNILSAGASLLNMSLIDLKKQLESKNNEFWLTMVTKLLDHRKQLENHRKITLSPGFFSIIIFLKHYFSAIIEDSETSQKREQEKKLDLQTIAETIRNSAGHCLLKEEFGKVLLRYKEKYQNEYDEFKKTFEEKYLEAPTKTSLPIIVSVGDFLIHSDNIHTLFLSRVNGISPILMKIYIALMSVYIRKGGQMGDPVFSTASSFEADIMTKVEVEDPVLHGLLQHPHWVAEAFISSSRKSKKLQSVEDMKLVLASFFLSDQIKFKHLSLIFGLDMKEIYTHGFLRLSLLRQIWMKLTGKNEGFKKQFNEQVQKIYETSLSGIQVDSTTMVTKRPNKEERNKRTHESSNRIIRKPSGSSPRSGIQPIPTSDSTSGKPKNYSRTEQENAWTEFSKSLKK
jgi:hypothetical protein